MIPSIRHFGKGKTAVTEKISSFQGAQGREEERDNQVDQSIFRAVKFICMVL